MRKSMKPVMVGAVALAIWSGAQAWGEKDKGHGEGHVVVRPDEIKWGPGPASLPEGAKAAALLGDPGKSAPYVIRVKLPDGYKVPPHWHPTDENVTVIQGTLLIGKGEKFSADATQALPAGSYMRMPKTMRHFAQAKGETILQVHGMGPFEITYVDPNDDPRKK